MPALGATKEGTRAMRAILAQPKNVHCTALLGAFLSAAGLLLFQWEWNAGVGNLASMTYLLLRFVIENQILCYLILAAMHCLLSFFVAFVICTRSTSQLKEGEYTIRVITFSFLYVGYLALFCLLRGDLQM